MTDRDSLVSLRKPTSAVGACDAACERVMGADSARAVGRFNQCGVDGYRAATAPDAPLRATREAAVDDERMWLGA